MNINKMEKIGLLDKKIKDLTYSALVDASNANWQLVADCFKEIAYCCARRGLTYQDFIEIRKEIILAMEKENVLAKTLIEQYEGKHVIH